MFNGTEGVVRSGEAGAVELLLVPEGVTTEQAFDEAVGVSLPRKSRHALILNENKL